MRGPCCMFMGTSLKLDVGPILAGSGRRLTVDQYVPLPPFAAFEFPQPAHAVLELAGVDRGVHVDGAIDVDAKSVCDRCLGEVAVPLHVDVEERFEAAEGKRDPLELNNVLEGDELDLADLVRQLTASSLPLTVLCDEACPGLCPRCGRAQDGECDCPTGEGEDGEP